jgi:diguanylate cyclase (GGDEF)-like protein
MLSDLTLVRNLRRSCTWTAVAATLIGLAGLAGWVLNIPILKNVLPGLIMMKANTAACIVLAGGTLWLALQGPQSQARNRVLQFGGLVVSAVGFITMLEKWSFRSFGIDQFLFKDRFTTPVYAPGQMAPNTTWCFVFLGLAMLFYGIDRRWARGTMQVMALAVSLVALLALNGYAFNVSSLYGSSNYSPMALNTSVALLLLGASVLCAFPAEGVMTMVTSTSAGSSMIRRLLPPALGLPPLLGFLHVQALRVGVYGADWGFIVQATTNISLFVAVLWWNSQKLHHADVERIRNQEQLQSQAQALLQADTARERFVKELEERSLAITLLGRMADLLQSCQNVKEACTVIGGFAQQLFPGGSGVLYLLDNSRMALHSQAHWGDSHNDEDIFSPEQCWALRRGKTNASDAGGPRCEHLGSESPQRATCIPMAAQGEILGVVSVREQANEQLSRAFVEQLALALANLKLRETLRNQAIRDPLTGLFNRRFMEESLDRELQRAARSSRPLGAILIDIDHFKQFNDRFGHEVGDAVLREVGAFLRQSTRGGDVACRYGGEEFAVILPEASLEITTLRAQQLRNQMSIRDFRKCGTGSNAITISLGVATYPEHGSTIAGILKAADTALYKAKADGRDRVVVGALSSELIAEAGA